MATRYGRGYFAPTDIKQPPSLRRRAVMRAAQEGIALTTSEIVNDKIYVTRIPSSSIIKPSSQVIHAAFGGTAALSWGILDEVPAGAFNCLGNNQTAVAAITRAGLISVPLASLQMPIWQIAGFTVDPGKEFAVGFTIVTGNIAAAGTLFWDFHFSENV
jgi:hypothetical protein